MGGTNSRLFNAAKDGDIDELQYLIRKGGDVNCKDKNGWTMLHHAVDRRNMTMMKFLKEMGANARKEDKYDKMLPLHIAAEKGNEEAICLLLEMSADSINDKSARGWTPLHYAALKAKCNAVSCLISKKADVQAKDLEGMKAVHCAVEKGHTDIVQIFLDKGAANIDDVDPKFGTLLQYSVRLGRERIAEDLIRRGSNINLPDLIWGRTALHLASENGSLRLVTLLVEKGADINISQKEGKLAFDLAIESSHSEVAAYLVDRMTETYKRQSEYNSILTINRRLLEIQKDDHEGFLKTRTLIAMTQHRLDVREERVLDRSKDDSEERLEAVRNFDNLCSKYETGKAYVDQGKYIMAKETFKDVYDSWRDSLGAQHPLTLDVLRDLATAHFQRCDYHKASEIYEDLLEQRKSTSFDANSPDILQAMKDLAVALAHVGKNRRALALFKQLLVKKESCLGSKHPDSRIIKFHIEIVQRKIENNPENGNFRLIFLIFIFIFFIFFLMKYLKIL